MYLFPSALWGPETCISPALARDHCQFMLHECARPLGLWAGHTSVSCSQIHSPQWHVLPVGAPSSVVTAGVPGQGRGAGAVCMWWVLTYCFSPPGHANASFCPHGYGCRTLVVCEGRAILDVTDSELTVTVRVPEGRWLWLVSRRLVSVLHPSYH